MILTFLRKKKAERLLKEGAPRKISIHSVIEVTEEGGKKCHFFRVAFEFTTPPGPWSMQFYEAAPGQNDVLQDLKPETKAFFYESEDGAKTRVLKTSEGKPLWPR